MILDKNNNNKITTKHHCLVISDHLLTEDFIQCLNEQHIQVSLSATCVSQRCELINSTSYDLIFVDPGLIGNSLSIKDISEHYDCSVLLLRFDVEVDADLCLDNEFGVVNWPMSTAQLAQLISFSLKHQQLIDRHQQEKQLLNNTISCIGDILIYLDDNGDITEINQTAATLFASNADSVKGQPWYQLIKARQDMSNKQSQQFIATAVKIKTVTKIHPLAILTSGESSLLVDGVISPVNYPDGSSGVVLMLRKLTSLDNLPTTQVPSQGLPSKQLVNNSVSGILLLSPDYLNKINLRYGHEYGDRILNAIAEIIREFIRPTDLSSHYGGTIFMVMFANSSSEQIKNIVNKLHQKLQQQLFLDKDIALDFSFGFSVSSDLINYSPVELFYFANLSLSQARDLGGQQVRQWQQLNTMLQIGNLDRLSGNVSKSADLDYQKMLMQWSILNYLDDITESKLFFKELLIQLTNGFELQSAAIFTLENTQLAFALAVDNQGRQLTDKECLLSARQIAYIKSCQSKPDTEKLFTTVLADDGIEVIVPINNPNKIQYFIKLSSSSDASIKSLDHHVLLNIADNIKVKIAKFAASPNKTKPLNDSFENDKASLGFWYRSNEMQTLMTEVAMVAPTNATVLITGESGTGKEMLAQSIHQASDRNNKPFVIFDCGAVVESLVESELFGHQKGSFTGADKNTIGRVQQADGGTLFLDEIGDMPIEVQVKLLRFVQEKQYCAVGSGKFKKVDVRLIAATNVDLKQKIKEGKFREDLYFRLNVFNIENIPLRNRKADILLIAGSYLQLYANEYDKVIHDFSVSAQQALNEYLWPGNIRELKNLIHRAVILCTGTVLDCKQLGLYPASNSTNHSVNTQQSNHVPVVLAEDTRLVSSSYDHTPTTNTDNNIYNREQSSEIDTPNTDQQLFTDAVRFISLYIELIGNPNRYDAIAPLVEFYLYQNCLSNNHQIALQAANQLNIAESTFRRRWKKLQQLAHQDNLVIVNKARDLAKQIIAFSSYDSKVLILHNLLARAAIENGLTNKLTSVLLGMSTPTTRRIIAQTV